jgi:hypothetical protein
MNRIVSVQIVSLITGVTLAASATSAAEIAVFPVNAINLDPGDAEAIGTVIAQAYARETGADVMAPRAVSRAAGEESNAATVAGWLGVEEYIEITAVGLIDKDADRHQRRRGAADGRIIVQAARRAKNGDVIYRAEMTATSLGDMEAVAARLARALHEKRPAAETLALDTVTGKEAMGQNRTFTEKIFGLKTGAMIPLASGRKFEPAVSLAFDTRLETKKYFLEFGGQLTVPTENNDAARGYGVLGGEIGGSYYLTDESISPYVGAGLLPRLIIGEGIDTPANMAAYSQVGVMFARESSTRLYADIRIVQNVTPIRWRRPEVSPWDGGPYAEVRGKATYPTEIGLQVGIGW